ARPCTSRQRRSRDTALPLFPTLRWREMDSNFPFRAVNEHRTAPGGPLVRIHLPPAKSLLRTRLRSAAGPDPRACKSWPSDHIGGGRIEVAHVETLRSRDEVTRHEVAGADVELHV